MAIQNTTFRVYVEKLGASEPTAFVGNEGDLFYDPNTAQLKLSDGITPGGISVTSFNAPSAPGIGTGVVIGTLDQISIISIGNTYQVALPNEITVPGTLQTTGITTISSNGSESFAGGDFTVAGKVRATRYSTVSDERLKTNIRKIENPLETVAGIEGVLFDWKDDNSHDVGLIAQDVERALPDAVIEANGTKTVNYNGVIGLLVEAVKELSAENQLLRMDVDSMKARL